MSDRFLQILILIATALFPIQPEACSCTSESFEQRYDNAEYVFSAFVMGVALVDYARTETKQKAAKQPSGGDWKVQITFDPFEDFKGNSSELDYIISNSNVGRCGLTPGVARLWIFFVNSSGHTDQCSGGMPWGGWSGEDREDFFNQVEWLRERSDSN